VYNPYETYSVRIKQDKSVDMANKSLLAELHEPQTFWAKFSAVMTTKQLQMFVLCCNDNQTATDVCTVLWNVFVPTIVLSMNCLRKYLSVIAAIMVQLWSCLLLVLASLCVVHTKRYPEERHRELLRTCYIYFEGVGYYR
jgi:hypothetical protein